MIPEQETEKKWGCAVLIGFSYEIQRQQKTLEVKIEELDIIRSQYYQAEDTAAWEKEKLLSNYDL